MKQQLELKQIDPIRQIEIVSDMWMVLSADFICAQGFTTIFRLVSYHLSLFLSLSILMPVDISVVC